MDLTQLTIMETAKKLREKIFVSELVSAYLNRIKNMMHQLGHILPCVQEMRSSKPGNAGKD